jgi:hypothetical protein
MSADFSTAAGAYGFGSWTPSVPGGAAIMAETQVGITGDIPSGAVPGLPFNWGNPLFWLLLLVLIFTGWVYGGFNFGAKKIGGVKAQLGRG